MKQVALLRRSPHAWANKLVDTHTFLTIIPNSIPDIRTTCHQKIEISRGNLLNQLIDQLIDKVP